MTPQARLALWEVILWLERPDGANQSLESLGLEPAEGANEIHGELTRLGYYRPEGTWYKLTAKGKDWINVHSDKSRRFKELQYLAFDEYRQEFAQEDDPHADTTFSLDVDWCSTRGATLREVKRALEALRRAELLALAGMGSDVDQSDMYKLSDFGKAACDDEKLIEEAIEGRPREQRGRVYHVQNNNNWVGQGQILQNTGAGDLTVDQGDMVFGSAVPFAQHAELGALLRDLTIALNNEALSNEDRGDANHALAQVGQELAKSPPIPARLSRWFDTFNTIVQPFEKVAGIAAKVVVLLRTLSLLP